MIDKKRGLGKGLGELLSATLGDEISVKLADGIAGLGLGQAEQSAGSEVKMSSSVSKASQPVQSENSSDLKDLATTSAQNLSDTTKSDPRVQDLKFIDINDAKGGPFQPRQVINHAALESLAESIKTQGVLQPIVVRPSKNPEIKYEIIAGERRWRAAKLANLEKVPALVRQISDEAAMAMALIENIQREDLNPIEEAMGLERLAKTLKLTHLQVAEAVGKSRASVTNSLRLLSLNKDVQSLLEESKIDMGHARALLSLSGHMQSQVSNTVVRRGLSVRETEKLVQKINEGASGNRKTKSTVDPNIRKLEEDLAGKLGAKVAIKHSAKGQGSLLIKYNDVDELEGILAHIK